MPRGEDAALLRLSGEKDVRFCELGRLEHVTNSLPRPTQQYPRLVHFLGNREKTRALKQIFLDNNFRRRGQECFASLRCDNGTLELDSPLYFTDSDPYTTTSTHSQFSVYGELSQFPIAWLKPQLERTALNDLVTCRLFFLFANIVCVFADDFVSAAELEERVQHWVKLGTASPLDAVTRPHLLLVTSNPQLLDCLHQISSYDLISNCFSAVEIFDLSEKSVSSLTGHDQLRDVINTRSLQSWKLRQDKYAHFSALHFQSFFKSAIAHLGETVAAPFNFLSAARASFPKADFLPHVSRFLRLCNDWNVAYPEVVSFVATALLMDAYPPGMPVFDPIYVYRHLYLSTCVLAFQHGPESLLESYVSDIGAFLAATAASVQKGSRSADLRAGFLRLRPQHWGQLKTNKTCLMCLCRAPEHSLRCGHSVCDNCVLIFGEGLPEVEYSFGLGPCLICQTSVSLVCRIKPPTAGVRIISIDGGGTRGAVPLESLCLLQELIGDLPVRECFDLAVGTSSGGLTVLGLFGLRLQPHLCRRFFLELAQQLFGNKSASKSIVGSFKRILRCWMADGVYDPEIFETALRRIFGSSRRLFSSPDDGFSGSKYAVITSSISDATPFVLCNYNGAGLKSHGYEVLRPEHAVNEPHIWEAARATSAAPVLYRPVRIGDLGDFQDGGLKHNNPARLACWESRRIWSSVRTPDVFLSLGTGSPEESTSKSTSHFRHILLDGFIPRLFRSCMAKSDGETMWSEFLNSVDDTSKQNYFRLNVPLAGAALLDDVTGMARLRESVRSHPLGVVTRVDVAKAMLSSCFFLELDHAPVYDDGRYWVKGSIRCRSTSRLVVAALSQLGVNSVGYETDTEILSAVATVQDDVCLHCRRYRRDVEFFVRHPSDVICVFMRTNELGKKKLSGFPESVGWFSKQQGFDAAFGNPMHELPGRFYCKSCTRSRVRGQKRGTALDKAEKCRKRIKLD